LNLCQAAQGYGLAGHLLRLEPLRKAKAAIELYFRRPEDYGLASHRMSRFSYLYILVSQVDPHVHYTGITGDLCLEFARRHF
jgi:hypothetical protein